MAMNFNFEIGEDKYSGKKDIAVQVGEDYWISSLLENFLDKNGYLSEVELVIVGILSSPEKTYDSIYDTLQTIKQKVEEKAKMNEAEFSIEV